jgi:hypothetical protein
VNADKSSSEPPAAPEATSATTVEPEGTDPGQKSPLATDPSPARPSGGSPGSGTGTGAATTSPGSSTAVDELVDQLSAAQRKVLEACQVAVRRLEDGPTGIVTLGSKSGALAPWWPTTSSRPRRRRPLFRQRDGARHR